MLIMGLDTALQRCSAAILKDGETVASAAIGLERGHAEQLAPMANDVLRKAGVKIADLDRIGVVVGPGGFTGVRVALSFARGLGVGTGLPIVGVTSLAALACAVKEAEAGALIAPIIDAKRGQVYAGLYRHCGDVMLEPIVATPQEMLQRLTSIAGKDRVYMVGTGARLISAPAGWSLSCASDQIDAAVVARLAAAAPAPKSPPAPVYLRPPDAKPPKPGPFDGMNAL